MYKIIASFSVCCVCLTALSALAANGEHTSPDPVACSRETPPSVLTESLVLQRLLACNRDVIAARRATSGARADQRIAGQTPNPTLTAGINNINPRLGIGPGSLADKAVDSSLRIEQVFERGGKPALRQAATERISAATEQDSDEILRQQRQAVLQAMVDVAATDGRVALQNDIVKLYEESVSASERRATRGDLAPIESERQAIEAVRAQADLRQAQTEARRARATLAGLLAWETMASSLKVEATILDVASNTSVVIDPAARSDVKAAQMRVEAAEATRELARAQKKADVTVGLQVDRWPTSVSNFTGTGNSIGFTVSIPLMVRHTFDGELARAISDHDSAEENLQRVMAAAQSDLTRLDDDTASVRARLALLTIQLQPKAERIAQAAELGYAKGALNLLELLDARRVLRQTQLDVLAARSDLARAIIARNSWIETRKN